MEDPVVRQPSTGTIISHNAHLLLDENENGPSGSIPNNGPYSVEVYDANIGDPSLEQNRPTSNGSSVRSREMDESPVDDGRNSKESLDEEARYQKELKDRVRKSYADLGMEPEGILLKDDEEIAPSDSLEINEELDYGKIKVNGVNSQENRIPDVAESYPKQFEDRGIEESEELSDNIPGNTERKTNLNEQDEGHHDNFPDVTEQGHLNQVAFNEYADTEPYANEAEHNGDEYADTRPYTNNRIDPSNGYADNQPYAKDGKDPSHDYADTEPYANDGRDPRNEYPVTEPFSNNGKDPDNEYSDRELYANEVKDPGYEVSHNVSNSNQVLDDEYGDSYQYANEAADPSLLPNSRHSERRVEHDKPYENASRKSAGGNRLSRQSRIDHEESIPEPRFRTEENYPQVQESFRDSLENDHPREVNGGQADGTTIGLGEDPPGQYAEETFRDSLDEDERDAEPGVKHQQKIYPGVELDQAEPVQTFQSGSNNTLQEIEPKHFYGQQEIIDTENSNNNAGVSPPPLLQAEGTERTYAGVVQNHPPSDGSHPHIENAAFNERRTPPLPPAMPPEPPPPILSGHPASAAGSPSRPRTNPFRVDSQHPGQNPYELQQQQVQADHPSQHNSNIPPGPPQPPNHSRAHPPPPPGSSTIKDQNPYHAEFLNQSALQQPLPYHDPSQAGSVPQQLSSQNRPHQQQAQQSYTTQNPFQDGYDSHRDNAPPLYPPENQSHPSSNEEYPQGYSNHHQPGLSHSRQSNHQTSAQDPKDGLQPSSAPLKVKQSPRESEGTPRVPLHMRPPEKSYLDQFREKQTSSNGRQNGYHQRDGDAERSNQGDFDQGKNNRSEDISDPEHNVRTLESEKGFQGYGRNSGIQPSGSSNSLSRDDVRKPSGPQQRSGNDPNGSLASLESLRFQALPRENSQTKGISKAEKTIKKLPSGEMLHVEYISDDSDDEEMHFVDEMGNPVDEQGNLLSGSPSRPQNLQPKLEYRIKPTPPKQKQSASRQSSSHQVYAQSSATRRTASGHRKLKVGVSQTGSQIPSAIGVRRQHTIDKAVGESKAPSPETSPLKSENTQTDVPGVEEVITSTVAEKEGELGGTIPEAKPPSQPGRSSGAYAPPVGDVRVSAINNQSQLQYGYPANMNPTMQMPVGPYAGVHQMPQQFVASQIPGQMVMTNQPAILSPNASYSFAPQMYAQIQPTLPVAMSPVQTILQPVMQPAPMYMGTQFQQQFVNPQVPQPPNIYGPTQGQSMGETVPAAPQETAVTKGEDSQESDGTYKNSEDEGEEQQTPPEDEVTTDSKQSQRQSKHPKGVRGMLADRNMENKVKTKNRKNQKNFIDANKNNVKNIPPDRKYRDRYLKAKAPKESLNKKQPLPDISQDEDIGEDRWAYREGADGYYDEYGEEEWARQLVEDQRIMAALKRHQSESNILDQQNRLYGPVRQRSLPQRHGEYEEAGEYGNRTFPPGQQPYSYSADRAVTYARMKGPGPRVGFQDDPRVASDGGGRFDARQRFAYTHPMPTRYSPFNVLPDIQRGDNELRVSDPNGYLMKMQKQRQPPTYKEYTVKDYRALKRDIRLGGLGPDTELIQERQEKANRQREYAKAISEQNKKALQKASKPWTPPKERLPGQENSRRGKALEYARKVPKPPLRTPPEELHDRLYGSGSKQSNLYDREGAKTYLLDEIANLDELAERHRQEKEEIERLRSGHAP
ncbi:Jhy protein-like [Holothuria leucospilota]|uniref:Jhy protein-like n=1 Tax=Holothuria leucospilota TaxID=206669 RepID=A0A9Q1BYP5_HOLLE|nr:Jhy protein-like [Holothuria leucospilota]